MKKLIFIFLLMGMTRLWGGDCPPPSPCEAFEYAEYASQVYDDGKAVDLACSGEKRLDSIKKLGDGLYAEVFERDDGYVIAFRGSKEGQDWIDNFDQGLNGHNEQFAEAMKYFGLVNKALNDCGKKGSRTIVGHSLGGALAQHVATIAEQKPPHPPYTVVTFNPAALLPINSPKPKVCVFNYVHGNDILKRVVNPLLTEIERADADQQDLSRCKLNNVASGYSGSNITVGVEVKPYDFKGLLTKEDVAELRDAAKDFPEIKEFLASGKFNIILNGSDKLDQLITRLSRIKGLEKVFTKIDPKLGADWKKLCSVANTIPVKIGLIIGPNFQPFLLDAAKKFQSSIDKVLGSAVNAHGIGEVIYEEEAREPVLDPLTFGTVPRPAVYTPDSMLDLLQKQCNGDTLGGSGGKNGDGSPGTTPGNGSGTGGTTPTDPNVPSGNNTVSGGCFGDVSLVNGRVPTFLDGMGQIIDGIDDAKENIETIMEGIEAAREVEAIAKKLKDQFDAFDKFTAGIGKAAPVINKIFDVVDTISTICDISTLMVDGYTALATGDKDAFADMINERVREAVVEASKGLGSTLGEFLGMAIGATGGPMAPLTSWFGGWLGGEVGEWIGEQVGGWAYDKFIADWVKENISDVLFDMMCPNYGGGGEIDPSDPTDPDPSDPDNPNPPVVPPTPPTPPEPPPPEILDPDSVKILPLSPGKILKSNPTQPYTREEQLKRYSK